LWTVWPKPSKTRISDTFFWPVLNRLDFFPDGFLQFMDGFKPSRIPNFSVVFVRLSWHLIHNSIS